MPVPAQVWFELGHHDQVTLARLDEAVAAGAQVALAGGMGLNRAHHLVVHGGHPASAHHRTSAVTTSPTTAATISEGEVRPGRRGLKPMGSWYGEGR